MAAPFLCGLGLKTTASHAFTGAALGQAASPGLKERHCFALINGLQAQVDKPGHFQRHRPGFGENRPGGLTHCVYQHRPTILQDLGQGPPPVTAPPDGGAGRSSMS